MSKMTAAMMQANTYPTDVRAQLAAGYACEDEGNTEKSLQFFENAWELGLPIDGRYRFYFSFGTALRKANRLEESEECFRMAIDEFPSDKAFPIYLAMTLTKAGKAQEGVLELIEILIRLRDVVLDVRDHKEELVEYLGEFGVVSSAAEED